MGLNYGSRGLVLKLIYILRRYADEKWDFVKGQLSTVDRNYGYVHYLIHSIGTHQMHHMFTKVITMKNGGNITIFMRKCLQMGVYVKKLGSVFSVFHR